MSNSRGYGIGKVVEMLQTRHPKLTVSKVRFLEAEGLITPRRTEGGYRKYSDEDVARLEMILRMQEETYLPLQVIRERLDSALLESERQSAAEEQEDTEPEVDELIPIDEAARRLSIPIKTLQSLGESGIVRIVRDANGRASIHSMEFSIARAAHELSGFGMDERLLRTYVQQANRELPYFRQILSRTATMASSAGEDVDARVTQTVDRLLELTNAVRSGLIKRSLTDD